MSVLDLVFANLIGTRRTSFKIGDALAATVNEVPPYSVTGSVSVSTGASAQTLTVAPGLKIQVGAFYRIYSAANQSLWVEGKVTAYSGTSLTILVDLIEGSGSFSDGLLTSFLGKANLSPTSASTSTSLTLVDVPGLTFKTLAGVSYRFKLWVEYQTILATTGMTVGITHTSTPTALIGRSYAQIGSTALASSLEQPLNTTKPTITATGVAPINTPHMITMEGQISFSTDTTVTFQHATEINLSAATLNATTKLEIERVL